MPQIQTGGSGVSRLIFNSRFSAFVAPIIGVLIFLPTLWYGFVWDDHWSITPGLQPWTVLAHTLCGKQDPTVSMYRPVTGSIIFFQYHIFGLHPWGYHMTSVLLHALACVLLFRLALQLSHNRSIALFASLLFAVHAIHLEAVAWVSALAEPLVASFVFAGLSVYLCYREERCWKWLATICLILFLGLLTKETAIVLPLLIIAYEFIAGDSGWRKLQQNLPLLYGMGGTVLTYATMRNFAYKGFVYNESHLPFRVMLFTWPSLLISYCKHLLIPTPLSPFYDSRYVFTLNSRFWIPVLLLTAIAAAVYAVSKYLIDGSLARFCALGMAICIIPVLDLSIFQFQEIMHDRFLYIPSAFFAIFVGVFLFGARREVETSPRLYTALGGFLVLLNVSALLIQRPAWKDDFALYSSAVRVAPDNPRPLFSLASIYLERGDLHHAELCLQRVVQIVPAPKALELLGQTRLQMNNPAGAEEPLRRAIKAAPGRPGLHFELGQCLQLLGRTEEARAEFSAEAGTAPDYREAAFQKLVQLSGAKAVLHTGQ